MGISNDLMIDVALNVVGFILAGLFTAVIYSMITKRKQGMSSDIQGNGNSGRIAIATPTASSPAGKIEFVDFKSGSERKNAPASKLTESKVPASQFQRNRIEVIKQAQEMLSATRPKFQNRLRPVVEDRIVKEAANDQ